MQLMDTPTRILRPETRSIPRLSYSLPPLTASELQDNPGLESLVSAASSGWPYRPRASTAHPVPEENPSAGYTSSQEAKLLQTGYSTPPSSTAFANRLL